MYKLFQNETEEQIVAFIKTMTEARWQEPESLETKADVLDVIMKFWPYIKPVLSIAKIFTNSKIDALIDAVITWGDNYTIDEE